MLTELETGCRFSGGGGNGIPSLKSLKFGIGSRLRGAIFESVNSLIEIS